MSSFLRDKYGNYHTEGTFLLITFFGGIVCGCIVGAIAWACTQDFDSTVSAAIEGFFGYYVVKLIIKFLIKKKKEEVAEVEQTNRWTAVKEYNKTLLKSITDAGQTLSDLEGDTFNLGKNAGKAVGTFIVPSGVKKLVAVTYSSIQWSGYTGDTTRIEVLINGKSVFSQKANNDTFRLAIYNVSEGDIVTFWVKTGDGTISGQLFGYFVHC